MLKICKYCRKEFTPTHGLQKYCSDKCRIAWNSKKCYEQVKADCALKRKSKICVICGTEFFTAYGWQKFCSKKCKRKAESKRVLAQYHAKKSRAAPQKTKITKLKEIFKLTPAQIAQRERFKEILLARRVERGIGDDFLYADS